MSETVVWGLAGIVVTILVGFLGAKKLKLWGSDIEVSGHVGGDVFVGKKTDLNK